MNKQIRGILAAGTALAVVGVAGGVWATSSLAATSRYQTATVTAGDVAHTYLTTGSIARQGVVAAAFPDDGTVSQVKVAVGDQVAEGDVLATLDTAALKLALLNAETDLANAKSTLYAAEHPATRSSGSSTPTTGATKVTSGITATDAATLYRAISAVNVAAANWSDTKQSTSCDVLYQALSGADSPAAEPSSTPTTTPTATPTASPTAEPSASPTAEPSASPTAEPSASPSAEPSATPTATLTAEPTTAASPTATATADAATLDVEQLALVIDDVSTETIKACGQARANLIAANDVLADYYQQLLATGTISSDAATASPSGKGSGTTASNTQQPASSGTSTSARQVAAAEADVLRAQQQVDSAESALDHATLVAPTAGTVATISLSAGASAASGTVTIVGDGLASVTIEAPLATRKLLSQGMTATVTPAGATTTLTGTVSAIATLETDGTAGDDPTYATTIVVTDPDGQLSEGAKAGVAIITATASGLTVPASALTPTGAGTGTVQVVESASASDATTVAVKTGAVGGGRVEITEGLTEGQTVVLSDQTLAIDTLTTNTSGRSGFGGPR